MKKRTSSIRSLPVVLLLIFCLALAACGTKKVAPPISRTPRDLLVLPQNLEPYAQKAGANKQLISSVAQREQVAMQKSQHYRPWTIIKPTRWVKDSLHKNFNMGPKNGYVAAGRPFPQAEWDSLVRNSNKEAYGKTAQHGVTLRHTNLRAMPSKGRFYLNPERPGEGYPFDYFQHTSLPMGSPLFICNVSKDGQWVLVETSVSAGWLPAVDVGSVDDAFTGQWMSMPLAALIRDKVPVGSAGRGHLGTLLPASGSGSSLAVLYPVRGTDEKAVSQPITLPAGTVARVPLPLTPQQVATIGNHMMGQPYGWGGVDEKRDCSALTRDMLAPFGIWLPRNSATQSRKGREISLSGMSTAEKKAHIATKGIPFSSLIWQRGHIGLYLGVFDGAPVMFHNIWGLRTKETGSGGKPFEGRNVIGKAVVTTLQPGLEQPNLSSPGSLLDRIEKVTVLP